MTRVMLLIRVFCLLLIWQGSATAQDVSRELVLVSSVDSTLSQFSGNDLRRLFLGLGSESLSKVTPVGNRSDSFLYEVFLQKVVYMSSRSYERHLLTKVFLTGNQRLHVAESTEQLTKLLHANPDAIALMWAEQARQHSEIKIIQSIWKGHVD